MAAAYLRYSSRRPGPAASRAIRAAFSTDPWESRASASAATGSTWWRSTRKALTSVSLSGRNSTTWQRETTVGSTRSSRSVTRRNTT